MNPRMSSKRTIASYAKMISRRQAPKKAKTRFPGGGGVGAMKASSRQAESSIMPDRFRAVR